MGVELPKSGVIFLPAVPPEAAQENPELFRWAQDMRRSIKESIEGLFQNDSVLATALNSGTSGTFTISSGGSIVVTSGVVITVTS
jgi:hypothetical protein